MLVGVVGLIGSGKDTVSERLVQKHNFKKDSFAKSLKDAVANIFNWDRELLEGDTKEFAIPDPKKLHGFLNEHVIGQDRAKKIMSVAVYNHFKRIVNNLILEEGQDEIEKSNVLMLGPSGVGKTLIAKKVAQSVG